MSEQAPVNAVRPQVRTTYTCATLDVPRAVYDAIKQRLTDAGYGHAFMEPDAIDLSGVAIVPSDKEDWHLSKDREAVVGDSHYLPMATCPRGAKCILLGPGHVAVLGTNDGDPQWLGWAPLPKIPAGTPDTYWDHLNRTESGKEPWQGQPDTAA